MALFRISQRLSIPLRTTCIPSMATSTQTYTSSVSNRMMSTISSTTSNTNSTKKPSETESPSVGRSPAELAAETHVSKNLNIPGQQVGDGGRRYVVLTTAGPDRVGIVHSLASHLRSLHANIEESRMTILGNDFAMILLLSLPSDVPLTIFRDEIQSRFPNFLVAARSTQQNHLLNQGIRKAVHLQLTGPDQIGIVEALTKILSKNEISVRTLETDTSTAPFAGYPVFHLKSVILIPKSVDEDSFMTDMQTFEEEYGVNVEVAVPGEGEDEDVDEDEDEDEDDDEDDTPAAARRMRRIEIEEDEDDDPRVRRSSSVSSRQIPPSSARPTPTRPTATTPPRRRQ